MNTTTHIAQHNDMPDENDTATEDSAGRLTEKLPALLRILGATALLFAMYSFLVRGWQEGSDLFRYLLLLGHTGMLMAIGLVSGHYLKESKGARLLLVLALASVPVNFAILGSLIYSQTTAIATAHSSDFPDYVSWTVDNLNTALLTSAGALVVLIPVVFLGFTVLMRQMAIKLSILFLFSNAAMLLPLRDPQTIGLIVLALTIAVSMATRAFADKQIAAKTSEGVIALGLQLLPLSVLAIRNLWLYTPDDFLFAMLCVCVFLMLRQASLCLEATATARIILDRIALIPALLIVLPLSSTLAALTDSAFLPASLVLPVSLAISAAMVYDLSRRSQGYAGAFRLIAIWEILLGMTLNLALYDGLLATLSCIVTGACLLMHGYQARQRGVFLAGAALMLIGMLQQLFELIYRFDLASWISFAILGIIAIVAGSVLESPGLRIRQRLSGWQTAFRRWEQ
ncbi:MAG: hypothetical protein LV471_01065 [Nitrosomonas sp.]|nr:hypothetical protein [Nitrosomonas sp.]